MASRLFLVGILALALFATAAPQTGALVSREEIPLFAGCKIVPFGVGGFSAVVTLKQGGIDGALYSCGGSGYAEAACKFSYGWRCSFNCPAGTQVASLEVSSGSDSYACSWDGSKSVSSWAVNSNYHPGFLERIIATFLRAIGLG
ncbi:MAG: hypothetical protein AABW54_00780 [Candidatus Micrarchaeota archaeon]